MKVLCAVDGSRFSRWAVESLGKLAGESPQTVVLLNVQDTSGMTGTRRKPSTDLRRWLLALKQERQALVRRMAAIASTTVSPKSKIISALAVGKAAETIVQQARKRRVDLIVLGSRGLSDIRGFLLGSVSRRVAAQAPCSVLVVKRPPSETLRVVLAVDRSKGSKAAADFFLRNLAGGPTEVTLVSVVRPIEMDLAARVLSQATLQELSSPKEEEARLVVREFRELFAKEGYPIRTEVLAGHPSHSIVGYLEHRPVDLVVVGTRMLSKHERLELGSVSESVLKYAPCAVMEAKKPRS